MTDPYTLSTRCPSVDEFMGMRAVAGLSARSREAVERRLPNTLFAALLATDDGTVVAMGRIVGDGGCNFTVVDIAVHPDHQRRGLGRRIMASLMEQLRANGPASAYVDLIADGGSPKLYAEFGFEPVAPASIGMALKL